MIGVCWVEMYLGRTVYTEVTSTMRFLCNSFTYAALFNCTHPLIRGFSFFSSRIHLCYFTHTPTLSLLSFFIFVFPLPTAPSPPTPLLVPGCGMSCDASDLMLCRLTPWALRPRTCRQCQSEPPHFYHLLVIVVVQEVEVKGGGTEIVGVGTAVPMESVLS